MAINTYNTFDKMRLFCTISGVATAPRRSPAARGPDQQLEQRHVQRLQQDLPRRGRPQRTHQVLAQRSGW